jgi:hypothetical protein
MDSTAWLIIAVIVVVAVIAGLLFWRSQQTKSARLKERFGPEYDRAMAEHESKKEAESRLASVEERRRALRIVPLRDESRLRYHRQWSDVQARFVDQPVQAVREGDQLIVAVMRERGYPMDDFDSQASMIALDHPDVVENYREAHEIAGRAEDATTEELRRAFLRYRELFGALVGQVPEQPPGPQQAPAQVSEQAADKVPDDRRPDRVGDDGSMPGKHRSPGT